jgi:hypothetical protein
VCQLVLQCGIVVLQRGIVVLQRGICGICGICVVFYFATWYFRGIFFATWYLILQRGIFVALHFATVSENV